MFLDLSQYSVRDYLQYYVGSMEETSLGPMHNERWVGSFQGHEFAQMHTQLSVADVDITERRQAI